MYVIWIVSPATFILILLAEMLFGGTNEAEAKPKPSWKYQLAPIVPVLGAFSYFGVLGLLALIFTHFVTH